MEEEPCSRGTTFAQIHYTQAVLEQCSTGTYLCTSLENGVKISKRQLGKSGYIREGTAY